MGREMMEALMEKWTADPEFREGLRKDLEGTIRAAGLELSEDELRALKAVDWTLSDEELGNRASKAAVDSWCSTNCSCT